MSLCFEVESLIHTPTSPPLVANSRAREEWYDQRREVVRLICTHFAWEQPPWDEPAHRRGREGYCCAWKQYNLLRHIAITLHQYPDQHTDLRQSHTECVFSRAYDHLTEREDSKYTGIYIPVPFDRPFQIATSFYWEICTVGSSI
jgi:hypothetical protein